MPLPTTSASDRDPREILVIKPSSLGDVVHTLPAVALVKKRWPAARLRWLINPEWAPLLAGNPHVDEVVIFPRNELRGLRGLARIPEWAKSVSARPADLVLDFQGLLRSGLIAKLCRARDGHIVGLSDAREGAGFFYHQKADVTGIDHAVDRYLALVAALGIATTPPLEWPLPEGSAPAGFSEAAPFVLLHPFSRGAGKSLSVGDVTSFCRALAPFRVVLAGRSEESVPPADNVENLLNRTTLPELIWLIRRAAFTVSVDSGPMHIAAALTPRLLSIHTWSDPRKVGPYRPEAWILKDGKLSRASRSKGEVEQPAADVAAVAHFVGAQL
ncbi:MAG: glycosyltransferase family 9 protein [Chthoniobacter sp.]|uniref:glycosyltransferase family 9 protein n=1 Tax=Chthoniobacter sp. TaxID=2510640 RepID=UPI0032A8A236